ncbi:hypothetical protein ACIBEA_30100 [Streptomyces sp. NPDC051555]|uniref:hypothetical protein n=1 Tax=Streptomyces sp. NPDC051555 TaxID=3365657 RepID=UPI0037A4A266
MSLLDIARAQGRHRGLSPAQLLGKIARLERALTRAKFTAITYATEATDLRAERDLLEQQVDTAGIEISGLLLDLATAREEGIRLKAALDNATSVHVAAGVRDITPGEDPTHPQGLDVSRLRARFGGTRPIEYVPLHLAAAAEEGRL